MELKLKVRLEENDCLIKVWQRFHHQHECIEFNGFETE
jgi:hypothetical protein